MENGTLKFMRNAVASASIVIGMVAPTYSQAADKAVVYQAFQSIQYLPLYVGMDKGIFAKHGVDVQKVTAGGGAQGVSAVIGGHADFSLQDPMTAILANLKGAKLTNVAMVVAGVPVWMVAPANSSIKSIDDLKDQTISVALPPSTSTYLLQQLLKNRNLSGIKLNTVQIGTELSPVSAGRAAAAVLYEPQVDQALASGYKIAYSFPRQYKGGYAFSTIDTLESTVKDKPVMVQNFVNALAEAEKLMQTSPDTAREVARQEFPTLDPAIVDSAVNRLLDQKIYATSPSISREAFANALDLQVYIGNIKSGQVTYESAVNNSFAEKAGR